MAELTHVLFDFFGTLVGYDSSVAGQGLPRSHRVLREAGSHLGYEEFLARWGGAFEQSERHAQVSLEEFALDTVCGQFLQHALERAPEPALLAAFRDTFLDEWNQGVRDLPGVVALLATLRQRFTVVLVSNTNHAPLVHGHLRRMAVAHCFHAVVTSIEHGRRKPSPCIFQRALALTGGTPEAAVYVGDSFTADYQGAVAAGLRPLLIDPERRHPVPDAHRIATIADTLARLEPA